MALLSKKEKLELAEIIANAVVTALKENSSNSQLTTEGRKSANEGTSSATQKKSTTKKSKTSKLTIKDFEPKAQGDNYNWKSYCTNRTKYCYFVATKGGVTDGKIFGTKFYQKDWSEEFASAFAKAKEEYTKKYKYIKLEDRK